MERYVKYLRKSRFDRDYAELSIEETLKRHETILDKLARDRGYHIAKTYYEVVSGESIAARPEIQKMLEEVSLGIYAGVLVVDVERLARGNGSDQAYISQVFQFSGTKIITPLKVYDPSNEFDEEYFEFGLFMSRREYKTINRRLVRGRDSSAAEGKYINSIAPYGYKRVKLPSEKGYSLELHPEESEVIKKIFSLFLNHAGTKIIANYLNDHDVPTRHGGLWSYSTITNIITNPVYMGKIRRGWSKQVKTIENGQVKKHIKRKKNLEDYQVFDGLHPALITEAEFNRAQEIRLERQPSVKVKNQFVLQNAFAGLLYCSVCGKRIGRTTTSQSRGSTPRLRCVNARNCHNGSANYDVVETEIIAALRTWLEGYQVKIDTVGFADEIAEQRALLEKYDQELAKLNQQLENAFDLVEQGVYTLELFKERREKLNASISEVKEQRSRASVALEKLESNDACQSNLIPRTEELLESYDSMTNQERNDLLKAILQKVEYQKGADGTIEIDLYPRLPHL
ncbi:MAG: recombinase family protein [Lawsonibacter sp.]|jgi:site-specific DNA recombinase|nr:recombinase family protein [Lawsonibacter sp.]